MPTFDPYDLSQFRKMVYRDAAFDCLVLGILLVGAGGVIAYLGRSNLIVLSIFLLAVGIGVGELVRSVLLYRKAGRQ